MDSIRQDEELRDNSKYEHPIFQTVQDILLTIDDISFKDASTLIGRSLVSEFSELDSSDSVSGEEAMAVSHILCCCRIICSFWRKFLLFYFMVLLRLYRRCAGMRQLEALLWTNTYRCHFYRLFRQTRSTRWFWILTKPWSTTTKRRTRFWSGLMQPHSYSKWLNFTRLLSSRRALKTTLTGPWPTCRTKLPTYTSTTDFTETTPSSAWMFS